jgi:hypothetical protein
MSEGIRRHALIQTGRAAYLIRGPAERQCSCPFRIHGSDRPLRAGWGCLVVSDCAVSGLLDQITDQEFWRIVTDFSEPQGPYTGDN